MSMALRRGLIVFLGLILQILITIAIYIFFVNQIALIQAIYLIAGIIIALYLIRNSKNYSYTLPWIIITITFPIIGALLYIILGRNKAKSKILKNIKIQEEQSKKYLLQDKSIRKMFEKNSRLRYLSDFAGYPVTINNNIQYYPLGEDAFKAMLNELKKARQFIFFEYFIVSKGKMWDSILEILEEKAREGIDVRVIYDDLGSIGSLPEKYPKELEKKGIKCIAFNRLNVFAGIVMNNRDHRKILVIDGKVAFSGGINIADEYINQKQKYGHWKDNAIKLEGDSVWNYTVMFLTMWNSYRNEDSDFTKFKYKSRKELSTKNGFVVPYGETPFDNEIIGEDIYLNIINQANYYVYIFTPYLIIDTDMINSLILAAKRGVDVRIVIPGIPDKKIVYTVSESYLEILIKGGVKIYKYTPGFIHSKVFISDDHIATVGTLNLDYRSLYLHFECGCYMEDTDIIKEIKQDLVNTIDKSHEVSLKEATPNIVKGTFQSILRIASPLM